MKSRLKPFGLAGLACLAFLGTALSCDYTEATGGGWTNNPPSGGTTRLHHYDCATCTDTEAPLNCVNSGNASPTDYLQDWDSTTNSWVASPGTTPWGSCVDHTTGSCYPYYP